MAAKLQLVRSTYIETTTVDLLDTSGFQLADPGWFPRSATPGPGESWVEETLDLEIVGDDHDDVATIIQGLDQMRRWAADYANEELQSSAVYFNVQLENESNQRQALVHSIAVEWSSPHFSGEMVSSRPMVRVVIERAPHWERVTELLLPQASPSAAAAVKYDYTAAGATVGAHDITGDMPARIGLLTIKNVTAGISLDEFWIGVRSHERFIAHDVIYPTFEEIWECEDGINTARGSDEADALASSYNRVTGTPSASDKWEKYLTLTLSDISANSWAQYGRFLWLLRAKVTSADFEVQLRFGLSGQSDDDFVRGAIIEVDSPSYDFFTCGFGTIPHRNLQAFSMDDYTLYDDDWAVQIWARRPTGSGNIYLDCLCPVPVDEGFVYVDRAGLAYNEQLYLGEGPRGQTDCFTVDSSGQVKNRPVCAWHNFRLPPGEGRMVIVYARRGFSRLTDQIQISTNDDGKYYERWLNLRGSE